MNKTFHERITQCFHSVKLHLFFYQGIFAYCKSSYYSLGQCKVSRHILVLDLCSLENALENRFHRFESMKSIHSILTNRHALNCKRKK